MPNRFILSTLATAQAAIAEVHTATDALPETVGEQFLVTVMAMGVCIGVVWVARRAIYVRKLLLRDAPGRPNSLGWPYIVAILAWAVANKIPALFATDTPEITTDDLINTCIFGAVVLAAALVAAHVGFRHGAVRGMGLSLRRWFVDTARGILGGLAIFPVCVGLFLLGGLLIPSNLVQKHSLLTFLGGDVTLVQRLLAICIACVIAPVMEEVLYRGLLQTALRRVLGGPWLGIVVSSVLFAAIHLNVAHDPIRVVGVQAMLPLFALAIVLGYNYERTGRLWPSIVIHMLFNAINVTGEMLGAG